MAGRNNIVLISDDSPCILGLQQSWFHLDVLFNSHTVQKDVWTLVMNFDYFALFESDLAFAPDAHCYQRQSDNLKQLFGSSCRVQMIVPYVIVVFAVIVVLLACHFLYHRLLCHHLLFYES